MSSTFSSLLSSSLGTGVIGGATVRLLLDDGVYNRSLATAETRTRGATGQMAAGFGTFGTMAAAGAAVAGAAVIKFSADAVAAASTEEEALNKATVTFGEHVSALVAFADTSAEAFGISKAAALDAGAGFGVMLKTAGLAEDAAADMSVRLLKLAADLASFNNISIDEALQKIKSGLAGEAEPLRQVGVLLSEARVKTEAYAAGIAKTGAELTEAEKVQARYNLILKDTADQQGDFGRTSDSLANQQRILTAAFKDAQAEVGRALLPVVTDLLGVLVDLVPLVTLLGKALEFVVGPLGEASDAFGVAADSSEDFGTRAKGALEGTLHTLGILNPLTRLVADGMRDARIQAGLTAADFAKLGEQAGEQLPAAIEAATEAMKAQRQASRELGTDIGLGLAGALAAARGETFDLDAAQAELANTGGTLAKVMADLEAEQRAAARAAREHTLELIEQRQASLGLAGGVLGLIESARSYADAQNEVNRLEAAGKQGTEAYRDAIAALLSERLSLEASINDVVGTIAEESSSWADAREQLREYGRAAGLSGEALNAFIQNALGPLREELKFIRQQSQQPFDFTFDGHTTAAFERAYAKLLNARVLAGAFEGGVAFPGGGSGTGLPPPGSDGFAPGARPNVITLNLTTDRVGDDPEDFGRRVLDTISRELDRRVMT